MTSTGAYQLLMSNPGACVGRDSWWPDKFTFIVFFAGNESNTIFKKKVIPQKWQLKRILGIEIAAFDHGLNSFN